jgi:hypothetical protein
MFSYIRSPRLRPSTRLGTGTRGGGARSLRAGAVAGTLQLTSADAHTQLFSAAALANERGRATVRPRPEMGRGTAVLSGRWDRGRAG